MRRTLLAVLALLLAFGVGIAGANTPPLAEAGLDQRVERGATVYLDAAGSTDPDGTIAGYEWTITAPDGSTLQPDCPTCDLTQFVPSQTGRYEVTVTVTDDDGATSRDTLYVTVNPANPPSLDLTGPSAIPAGDSRTYRAEATAGDAHLSSIGWRINGTSRARRPMSGESATMTKSLSFPPGEHNITVTVIDNDGQRATDNLTVQAVATTGPSAIGLDDSDTDGTSGGGSTEELITFNVDTGTWDVNTELASRMDADVRVGDAVVTTEQLEHVKSSEQVVSIFERHRVSETQMVRSAAQRRNNCVGGGCGLDTIDNEPGQVPYTGPYPNDDSGIDTPAGSGSSSNFAGGYAGSGGSSGSSGSYSGGSASTGDSSSNSSGGGGYNGGSSYTGGGGYGF